MQSTSYQNSKLQKFTVLQNYTNRCTQNIVIQLSIAEEDPCDLVHFHTQIFMNTQISKSLCTQNMYINNRMTQSDLNTFSRFSSQLKRKILTIFRFSSQLKRMIHLFLFSWISVRVGDVNLYSHLLPASSRFTSNWNRSPVSGTAPPTRTWPRATLPTQPSTVSQYMTPQVSPLSCQWTETELTDVYVALQWAPRPLRGFGARDVLRQAYACVLAYIGCQ